MKKNLFAALVLAVFGLLGSTLNAAPGVSPGQFRAIVSGQVNYLSLEIGRQGTATISFQAFGTEYVLPGDFFGKGSGALIAASGVMHEFTASRYVAIVSDPTGTRNRLGLPIFTVKRIEFRYSGPIPQSL